MSESNVILFGGDDAEMLGASEKARATFKYFWRELAWEHRRIVPALDLACVKAAFTDGPGAKRKDSEPEAEHMWVDNVDFDGKFITGNLLNSPNWLKSIKQGDEVSIALAEKASRPRFPLADGSRGRGGGGIRGLVAPDRSTCWQPSSG